MLSVRFRVYIFGSALRGDIFVYMPIYRSRVSAIFTLQETPLQITVGVKESRKALFQI